MATEAETMEKTPKAKKEKVAKTIELPTNNFAQHIKDADVAEQAKGGSKLTKAVKKVKAASLGKVRENFPGYLHLLPLGGGKAAAFIWDTREVVEIVETAGLEDGDYITRIKDSGAPLVVNNAEVIAALS